MHKYHSKNVTAVDNTKLKTATLPPTIIIINNSNNSRSSSNIPAE